MLSFEDVNGEETFAYSKRPVKIGDEIVCNVLEYHPDSNWWKVDIITNISAEQRAIKKRDKKKEKPEIKEKHVSHQLALYNSIFMNGGELLDKLIKFQCKVRSTYRINKKHYFYLLDLTEDKKKIFAEFPNGEFLKVDTLVLCQGKTFVPERDCYRTTIKQKLFYIPQEIENRHETVINQEICYTPEEIIYPNNKNQTVKKVRKSWRRYLTGIQIRRCKRANICSCCGTPFDKDKGYKVVKNDIYLCEECHSSIRPKRVPGKSRRPRPHIISVPMGGQPKNR